MPVVTGTGAPLAAGLRGSVMLLGNFDGLHLGHRQLLELARELGRPLSILQCDPHPQIFFRGPSRLLISPGLAQRHLLAEAGVAVVHAPRFDSGFAALSPAEFLRLHVVEAVGATAVVAGPDFRFGAGRSGDLDDLRRFGRAHGFAVLQAPEQTVGGQRVASTDIRIAIRSGLIDLARRLLGRPWMTEILAGWRFADDQCLPPPGSWRVRLLDADSVPLGETELHLEPSGRARMAAPPATRLLEWI